MTTSKQLSKVFNRQYNYLITTTRKPVVITNVCTNGHIRMTCFKMSIVPFSGKKDVVTSLNYKTARVKF